MSRYFYERIEDIPKNESLNKYHHLFLNYSKSVPSLTEALNQMFSSTDISEQKINELTEDILSKIQKHINIVFEDIKEENREERCKQRAKDLFIFLKALRKLDRYYPTQKYMYRCINRYINIKEDLFNKKIIPYQKGVKKTFYGFTSISTKENTIYYLNGKQKQFKEGTIFTIHGNYFGYDISLFNNSLEEEIIIEPENNFLVESAIFSNNFNHIKII